MADRSVLVRLMANVSDFKSQMSQAQRSVKGVGDETEKSARAADTALGRMAQSAQRNRAAWDDAGQALAAFGAVSALAIGATVKAAVDWESAWAGVTKTVSGTPAQLAAVESGLRGLARTLPSTHQEIAAVAEAAGQLGVQTESIVAFTKVMVDLGETTNLTAEEAATSIAQMMNVMQTAPDDVGRLGATLVALGNDGASTERDIIQMSQRIAGAAAVVGMSEGEVMALANAVSSMGIEVEAGGTSVSRVLTDMSKAAQTGGESLNVFAETAGMSAKEFSEAFLNDPARAFEAFTTGLGGIVESGGNAFAVLSDLGLSDVRVSQALLGMASSGDLLTDSLDLQAEAWADNTALSEEAGKRYDTTAAKLAIARNNINDAAIEVGEVFLPMLASFAEGVADLAGRFADLPEPVKAVVGGLGAVASVGALAGGAFLLLFPRVIETYKAFQTLRSVSPGLASNLGAVGKAAGIAGIVWAAGSALDGLVKSMQPAPPSMEETTRALLNMTDSFADIDAQFSGLSSFLVGEIDGLDGAIQRLTQPSNLEKMSDWTASVITLGGREGNDEREVLIDQFDQIGQSLAFLVDSGNAELAATQFEMLSAKWVAGGGSVEDLMDLLPAYDKALQGVANEQQIAAESARVQTATTGTLAEVIRASYGSIEGYAAALGLSEEATEELITKTSELGQSLADFINPLGAYTGLLGEKQAAEEEAARKTAAETDSMEDSWEDYYTKQDVSIGEYMARLEEQVVAQQDWSLNMLLLSGRVSQGTIDELARMGVEGADLVAELVNASDEELDRFDDITALRSKQATDAWGAQLTMAAPVLTAIAEKLGQDVADGAARELAAGATTVAEIAARYGINLAAGINPLLKGLGKPIVDAWGTVRPQGFVGPVARPFIGPVQRNADGNLYESHSAEIAPAGAWRVWAEPETGGEAYIPLSPAKRARSMDIWRETGRRLGAPEVDFFEFGGISDVPKPYSTDPFRAPISTAADATMEKAYNEVANWMRANPDTLFAGPMGGGAVAPHVGAMFAAVRAAFPRANLNSGFRFGDPGYHGLGRAVDLGEQGFAGGAGRPYLAQMAAWIYRTYGKLTRELIYTGLGDTTPDLKNGRPLNYGPATNAAHRNHVHWAMAEGGILNPHIRDAGGPLLPGFTFNGTGRPEWVTPMRDAGGPQGFGGAPNVTVQARVFVGDREITDIVRIESEAVFVSGMTTAIDQGVFSR